MRVRIGGRRRSVKLVVDLLADEVDSEGDEGDAEAGSGVAQLVRQHRVLPPLVPPPEELTRRSQWFRHFSLSLYFLSPSSSDQRLFGLSFPFFFAEWKGKGNEVFAEDSLRAFGSFGWTGGSVGLWLELAQFIAFWAF